MSGAAPQVVATPRSVDGVRVERVVTSGVFALDGGRWEVDNNIWLIGDDAEVLIVDAAHDAAPILEAVGQRRVVGLVCTHGHNDHINAAGALWDARQIESRLHPADLMLWHEEYPVPPDHELADGQRLTVAGVELEVVHTPGHSPGAVCLHVPALGVVLTGDTLFQGGPGATGRSYSDGDLIIESITQRLLTLPEDTLVLTGHGDNTTIGAEAPHRQEWLEARR